MVIEYEEKIQLLQNRLQSLTKDLEEEKQKNKYPQQAEGFKEKSQVWLREASNYTNRIFLRDKRLFTSNHLWSSNTLSLFQSFLYIHPSLALSASLEPFESQIEGFKNGDNLMCRSDKCYIKQGKLKWLFAEKSYLTGSEMNFAKATEKSSITLSCQNRGQEISRIAYASYGRPRLKAILNPKEVKESGRSFFDIEPSCHVQSTLTKVEEKCKGKSHCHFYVDNSVFGEDPCAENAKELFVQYSCSESGDAKRIIDKYSHKFAIITLVTEDTFVLFRALVGSIHHWDPRRFIIALGSGLTYDMKEEIELMEGVYHIDLARWDITDGMDLEDQRLSFFFDQIIVKELKLNQKYTNSKEFKVEYENLGGALTIGGNQREEIKKFIFLPSVMLTEVKNKNKVSFTNFFTVNDLSDTRFTTCNLKMNPIYSKGDIQDQRKKICLCIITYSVKKNNKEYVQDVQDLPLIKSVLPSFLSTIQGSQKRFKFEIFLGTQADPFFDDRENYLKVMSLMQSQIHPLDIPIKVFRYPFSPSFMDVTYKWNALINEAYQDGCDYFYQYSDDSKFVDSGWAEKFVDCLSEQGGFGIAGAVDLQNPRIMTLSFSGRKHLEIFGSYWPTEFKNWYSDDWAQHVYGKQYTCRMTEVRIQNTQLEGQRYSSCHWHGDVYLIKILKQSRSLLADWLSKNNDVWDSSVSRKPSASYYQKCASVDSIPCE